MTPARSPLARLARGGCAALLLVAVGACGSTVHGAAAPDLPTPTTAAPVDAGTGSAPGTVTGTGGSSGSGPSAAGDLVRASSAVAGSAVAGAAGTPRRTVKVGFFISDDASQIYKTLGISGATHTREESRALWGAVVAQVNARGGLAGARVVPTYFFITSDSGSNASRAQQACTQFTEDDRVVAVVMDGAGDLSLARCLAKRHTPLVDVGQTSYPYDDVDLRALAPYLYLPGRLSMSRFGAYVDELAGHGFFGKHAVVGLVRFDLPDQARTAKDVIAPALRRHGLALTTDVAFTPVEGTGDLARASDEASAAVVRMRAAGVDHVLFLGSGLSLPYVFPTVAESQGYRPRYGITTDDGPEFMAGNAPAAQMTGAMAVGWEPQYDVADSDSVLAGSPVWRSCVAVLHKAGFAARDGRRCTAVYFLEAALRGQTSTSAGALRRGADLLGTTVYSTQTYATDVRPGHYDAVSAVRVLAFDSGCTCFRYRTGDVAVR